MNTKLYQLIVAPSLAILAVNSCLAGPPFSKPTPSQTPNVVPVQLQADGDRIIAIADVSNPKNNLAFVKSGGAWALFEGDAIQLLIVNGTLPGPGPTPTPTPTPGPNLNPRATAFRDAALKATTDGNRQLTARTLANGYMAIVGASYSDPAAMFADVQLKTYFVLQTDAQKTAWSAFRGTFADAWNKLSQTPHPDQSPATVADFSLLLQDAIAGLSASALTP